MATDYLLFVHGVKSRSKEEFYSNAQTIFQPVSKLVSANQPSAEKRQIQAVRCFWGDSSQGALDRLQDGLNHSLAWKSMWFREFRESQILSFVGDAALYLSRSVGSDVVNCIYEGAVQAMSNIQEGDRLHLITHSWGTVILFDLLFAKRWESSGFKAVDPKTWENVQRIRNTLFGMGENPNVGLKLGSIHTMGSPIALFNLMNTGEQNSHDIAPDLAAFLQKLRAETGKPLPWNNYLHPGDPIAYPLEGVSQQFFAPNTPERDRSVIVEDILVKTNALSEKFMAIAQSNFLSILYGGTAHNSYWKLPEIPKEIAKTIGQSL